MSKVKVSVLVSDDSLHQIDDVVKRIKDKGMTVDQILEHSGVVTGSVDADKLAGLDKVNGISSVESERAVRIAPPESKIQ